MAISLPVTIESLPTKSPNTKPMQSNAVIMAKHLQKLAYAEAIKPKITPSERTRLMRAFCELGERIRILTMKPLPKSVDAAAWKESKRSSKNRRGPGSTLTPNFQTLPAAGDTPKEETPAQIVSTPAQERKAS